MVDLKSSPVCEWLSMLSTESRAAILCSEETEQQTNIVEASLSVLEQGGTVLYGCQSELSSAVEELKLRARQWIAQRKLVFARAPECIAVGEPLSWLAPDSFDSGAPRRWTFFDFPLLPDRQPCASEQLTDYKIALDAAQSRLRTPIVFFLNISPLLAQDILFVIRTTPLLVVERLFCPNYFYLPPQAGQNEDNAEVRVQRLLRSLVGRKRAEDALRYRLAFEELITSVSTRFINAPAAELDESIQHTLRRVGEFLGADRAYVFQLFRDGSSVENTHEWCADGVPSRRRKLQTLPVHDFPLFGEYFRRREVLCIPQVSALPASAAQELAAAGLEGVASLFCVPLRFAGAPIGFIGVHSIGRPLAEHADMKVLLQNVGEVVANALERKRAEAERRFLEAQFLQAQKLESLGVMAGGIAHDFNNLLTGVIGNAGLALRQLDPDSLSYRFVSRVKDAAARAADLCERMLAYAGKGKFEFETVDLSSLVRDIAQFLEACVPKKAAVHYRLGDRLPLIDGDPAQIRQVIMNLVNNAVDALEGCSGSVDVSTGAEFFSEAELRAGYLNEELHQGEYVFLEVADSGAGMSPETLSHVFDPFFTTKFSGRGLGLAVVLGVVRSHHGAVLVSSEPGKGSVFRILFPAAVEQHKEETIEPLQETEEAASGATALVVDDEEVVRTVAASILEQQGFKVYTAKDGAEAIRLFSEMKDRVDFVLLDLTMPLLGGKETLNELRRIRPDVPVLLSSGYSEHEKSCTAIEERAISFIRKPYTPLRLAEQVKTVLRESAAAPVQHSVKRARQHKHLCSD